MQVEIFRYYCYACMKSFETTFVACSCKMCDSCAIESVQQEGADRQQFQVYQVRAPQTQSHIFGVLSNGIGPRNQPLGTVVTITSAMFSGQNFLNGLGEGSYLGNLLRQLMQDGNRMTAATEEQIQRLQKIECVQCSICQSVSEQKQIIEQQQIGPGFKLQCNHTFHEQCIRPWFQRSNTCPVCRKILN